MTDPQTRFENDLWVIVCVSVSVEGGLKTAVVFRFMVVEQNEDQWAYPSRLPVGLLSATNRSRNLQNSSHLYRSHQTNSQYICILTLQG